MHFLLCSAVHHCLVYDHTHFVHHVECTLAPWQRNFGRLAFPHSFWQDPSACAPYHVSLILAR